VQLDAVRSQDRLVVNDTIAVAASQFLCIGNRFVGGRTPMGRISYAAMYASALTPSEIQANASRLINWDDR